METYKQTKCGKTFAIGDIHGSYKALLQVIERSGIDKEVDTLIVLGDVCDGWSEVPQVVDELLTFKHLIPILGNHDKWLMDWVDTGIPKERWLVQGGRTTKNAYASTDEALDHMVRYFNKAHYKYLDDKNRLFVHGGLNWKKPLDENDKEDFLWDRHAYGTALQWEQYALTHPTEPKHYFKDYEKIFVGHTTTQYPAGWNYTPGLEPVFASNLVNLDTGAGWNGKLTIMDVDTHEYWQSDLVTDLYAEEVAIRD